MPSHELPALYALPHSTHNVSPLAHHKLITPPGTAIAADPSLAAPTSSAAVWAHDVELFAHPLGPEHKPNKLPRRAHVWQVYSKEHVHTGSVAPYLSTVPRLYGQPTKHLCPPPAPSCTGRSRRSSLATSSTSLSASPSISPRGSLLGSPRCLALEGSATASGGRSSPRDGAATGLWETTSVMSFRPFSDEEMRAAMPRRGSATPSVVSSRAESYRLS